MASQEFHQHLTGAVIGTGGWGETGLETENCQSSKQTPKNAPSPSRPVHPRRSHAIILYERNGGATCSGGQQKYTPMWQARKPYKAVESIEYDPRGAPWFPDKLI